MQQNTFQRLPDELRRPLSMLAQKIGEIEMQCQLSGRLSQTSRQDVAEFGEELKGLRRRVLNPAVQVPAVEFEKHARTASHCAGRPWNFIDQGHVAEKVPLRRDRNFPRETGGRLLVDPDAAAG